MVDEADKPMPEVVPQPGLLGNIRKRTSEYFKWLISPPEKKALGNLAGRIISGEEFDRFVTGNGFKWKRDGTIQAKWGGLYLSRKSCHTAQTKDQANDHLAVLQKLTEIGIFNPTTQWTAVKDLDDSYSIFAVMKGLKTPTSNNPFRVKIAVPTKDWESRFGRLGELKDKALQLVNRHELKSNGNWGFNVDNLQYYPVDTEVISLTTPAEQPIVKELAKVFRN